MEVVSSKMKQDAQRLTTQIYNLTCDGRKISNTASAQDEKHENNTLRTLQRKSDETNVPNADSKRKQQQEQELQWHLALGRARTSARLNSLHVVPH